ncbi:uncharacterized protein LOC18022886 [Eutrema salsugineum]|uniref:uncharacterized protein LOC18022886 n=1 Tax=Eutrema salsugineum TaxID=72664 RepID=UPI000CED2123|nr:uncharacterized protein LOC18022886 [Eutrema salsugineum]
MKSIEPPSFSLGFEIDAVSDPNPGLIGDDEPDPGLTVSDSDLELEASCSSPVLKRLRRGVSNFNKCPAKDDINELLGFKEDRDDDDDIEEFSSPEAPPASTRSQFSSCSSKVSLHGSGAFTSQPSSISRSREKGKPLDRVPASTSSGITSVAPLFQGSARSPLRRFQLLDSDSEDDHPSTRSRDLSGATKTNNSSSREETGSTPCPGDLLKHFPPVAASKIQTPAQRRFQLLDSDSEDDHPSSSRDLSRVTKTNDSSSKRKESGSMPCTGDLLKDFPPVAVSKTQTPTFQLLDSDSEDEHASSSKRDLSRVTKTNGSSSKSKESGSMPCTGDLWKEFSPAVSKTQTPALREYQLLDSDSEDDHPFTSKRSRVTKTNKSSLKDQPSVASKPKRKKSEDLWKDFPPAAVCKIQTPALDDICQDYFSSIKRSTSSTAQKQSSAVASCSNSGLFQQTREFLDFPHPSPPSHRFFLHSDPRIQNLVRKRLPNFLPLGIVNDRENRPVECLIDYMNQFGSSETSKTVDSSSRRRQAKSKVSKGQNSSNARSAAPKDAGKRRVSANSGSAGHWFTSSEGRKVYISKTGQEFSGQSAYRCYRKETGGGFKKSRKKRQPKKKSKN